MNPTFHSTKKLSTIIICLVLFTGCLSEEKSDKKCEFSGQENYAVYINTGFIAAFENYQPPTKNADGQWNPARLSNGIVLAGFYISNLFTDWKHYQEDLIDVLIMNVKKGVVIDPIHDLIESKVININAKRAQDIEKCIIAESIDILPSTVESFSGVIVR